MAYWDEDDIYIEEWHDKIQEDDEDEDEDEEERGREKHYAEKQWTREWNANTKGTDQVLERHEVNGWKIIVYESCLIDAFNEREGWFTTKQSFVEVLWFLTVGNWVNVEIIDGETVFGFSYWENGDWYLYN